MPQVHGLCPADAQKEHQQRLVEIIIIIVIIIIIIIIIIRQADTRMCCQDIPAANVSNLVKPPVR